MGMGSVITAATFAWRLTVEGAESVAKTFGMVGKSANENLKGSSQSADHLSKSLRELTGRLDGMAKQAEGLDKLKRQLLAIAALGGMTLLVETSLQAAANVRKMSDDTGFAVGPVQELTYALKLMHVEQETALQTMQNFSAATAQFVAHNSGPAKQAFETLFGADAQKIAQQGLLNIDKFYVDVLDRIGKLKSQAQKIDLAKEFFGRPGAGLVGAADQGRAAFERLREEARQLGIVFTEDMINKSEEAGDKLETLEMILKTKLYIAINENADAITDFADVAIDSLPAVLEIFGMIAGAAKTVQSLVAGITISMANWSDLAGQAWDRFMRTPDEVARGAKPWNFDNHINPLIAFGDGLTSPDPEIQDLLGDGKGKGGGKGKLPIGDDTAVAQAKAQAEAYDKLTFSLKEQMKAVGETDRQQFISNELRKLGAKATQEQRAEIEQLAGMLYDERQAWSTMETAATSAFSVITDGLEAAITNAEDFDDVLKNVLKSLAQVAYKALIGDPVSQGFSNLLSGGGGSGISLGGGLTGSFAADGMSFIPKFDIGTDYVQRTGLAMIHEGESIVPAKANRGYSGGKSNVFNVDMRGASVEAVARLEQMVKEVNGSIENRALMAFQQAGIRSLGF